MDKALLISELQFKAVRSSGAGGQHVNKVSSKIELIYNLENSHALSDFEKSLVQLKLVNRINKEKVLLLQCDESRSQHKNKELIVKRFIRLIEEALIVPKVRKRKKLSRAAKEKRLNSKKRNSLKKQNRRKPDL